jgi:predicted permease
MKLLTRMRRFLATRIHRSDIELDMDEELRSHLYERAVHLEQLGLSRAEAERRARIEFGSYERWKEECRGALGMYLFETFVQDVRFGMRMLRKTPVFTIIAVLTLAFGIGANTAIFSLVNSVMLQSLPVRDPGQLVILRWSARNRPNHLGISSYGDCERFSSAGSDSSGGCSFSYPLFKKLRSQGNLFSSVMAFAGPAQLDLSGNGQTSMVQGELVSGNYFQTLGVSAVLGRTLEPADEEPAADGAAVLNYGYWQTAFASSAAVIGKMIRLNGTPFTIVGVSEPRFTRLTPGKSQDLWITVQHADSLNLRWGGESMTDPAGWWLTIAGRLKTEMPRSQAQAAISLLFRNETLHGEKPPWKTADDPIVTLLPAQKGLVGLRQKFGEPLNLLVAAVAIILLIACANVAGLMLARAAAREREMAVRLALGAGRRRVIQQLLTESVLLSLAGAALGILLAYWGVGALWAFLSANGYSSLEINPRPDVSVLLFTISVAVLAGIGFGLAPAFRGAAVRITHRLAANTGSVSAVPSAPNRGFGLRGSLVIVQVAFSVVVLIGATLLTRTLEKLHSVAVGFDTRNILLFSIDPTLAGYKEDRIRDLYGDLDRRLAALPGVTSVSYSSDALLDGGLWTSVLHVEGQSEKSTVEVQMLAVGPGFFETMRIPLAMGRTFATADMSSTQPVAIVNQAFVRRFAQSRYPIGLHIGGNDPKDIQYEIIGVVGDTKYVSVRGGFAPTAYLLLQDKAATFALRTALTPAMLIPSVRNVLKDVDDNLPVFGVRTQAEAINRYLLNERMVTGLFALFGVLGLVLSCLGLYGLLSYNVALRTREIGIRVALGAQRRDALFMIIREAFMLIIFGSMAGIVAAFVVTRFLQSLLFDIRPSDPVTFVAVCALLLLVGLLASLAPARRATQVEPVVALRYE